MKANILKHTAFLLILAGCFSSCAQKNQDDNPNKKPDETENVRLVKILQYPKSTSTEPTGEIEYTYDKAGNRIKESFYNCHSAKILERYNEYEYSGSQKTKMKIYDGLAGNPTLGSYIEYHYVGGRLVKEETYCGRGCYGSLIHSMNYEYDKRGNLVLDYMYDPSFIGKGIRGGVYDTGILGYRKYVYDNRDRLITVLTTDGILDFYPCLKYTYDNDGKIIKKEYHEYEGLNGYETNVYNKTSKLLEIVLSFDKNGNQTNKLQHFYDELGNLTEIIINDECSKFKRKYNGKLLIEEIHYWWHEYGFHGTGQMPESGMSRYVYEQIK